MVGGSIVQLQLRELDADHMEMARDAGDANARIDPSEAYRKGGDSLNHHIRTSLDAVRLNHLLYILDTNH